MRTVVLPIQFKITAVNKFTSQLLDQNANPTEESFTFDFEKLNFIDGSGYTVLSNAIGYLLHRGIRISFRNFKQTQRPAIQYLDDCGFFRQHLNYPLRREAQIRNTTIPCQSISHDRGFDWIENKLGPWLSYALDKPQSELASVRTCVKEVWNNVADHSTMATGFVHSQHYPNAHQLRITLSDFGLGIPETIKAVYGEMPDQNAIALATRNGVTARSKANNMGVGLSYLVDTVLAKRGKVRLHSRNGNVTFYCDMRGNKVDEKRGDRGVYPGTLVEIELDTRLFIGDDDERGDFEWM